MSQDMCLSEVQTALAAIICFNSPARTGRQNHIERAAVRMTACLELLFVNYWSIFMSQPMTYAQALNEAKNVIMQQAARIKSDAERMRTQQQTINEQGVRIVERENRIKDQTTALVAQTDEIRTLGQKLDAAVAAHEQAEALIQRQDQRMTSLQENLADLERQIREQSAQVEELRREREELLAKLPTQEDIDALAAMTALLARRSAQAAPIAHEARPPMRLAEAA